MVESFLHGGIGTRMARTYDKIVFAVRKADVVFGCFDLMELEDFFVKFRQKRRFDGTKRYMIEMPGLIPTLLRVAFSHIGCSFLRDIYVNAHRVLNPNAGERNHVSQIALD